MYFNQPRIDDMSAGFILSPQNVALCQLCNFHRLWDGNLLVHSSNKEYTTANIAVKYA